MSSTILTGIAVNTPQGHDDVIRLNLFERAVYMATLSTRLGADFVVLNEFGPSLRAGWISSGWNVYLGPNNNGPGQRYACNAVAWNPDVLAFLDVEVFAFPFVDQHGRKRTIHIPVVLFRVKSTGERFAVFLVHVPTRRDASDFKRGWINLVLKSYALRLSRKGIVPVIGGDRNDGFPEPWWVGKTPTKPGHFFRLEQHQVDWLIARNPKRSKAGSNLVLGKVLKSVYRRASDHHAAVLAKFTLENSLFAGKELPPKIWKRKR